MIEGTIHGRKPSPRALLWGWDDQPEMLARLERLFPTSTVIEQLGDVRQGEFDVLISRGRKVGGGQAHLYVLAFQALDFGTAEVYDPRYLNIATTATIRATGSSIAREFVIPDGLNSAIAHLVRQQLLPDAESQSSNPTLRYVFGKGMIDDWISLTKFRPFLATTEPQVLAGSFVRKGGEAQCWAFPDGVRDPVSWVAAALEEWQSIDPQRFPPSPAWEHQPQWSTGDEERARALVERARSDQLRRVQEAEKAVAEAEDALAVVRAEADAGIRRLLVAQGPDLVAATIQALESLGFEVRDMDDEWPDRDKREDLRVRDPIVAGWEALAEVRGYTKGAQQKDLLRIAGRFVLRYIQDEGRPPDAAWYVVNHFLSDDPATRPRVLAANDAEVKEFSEGGAPGLVIDAVALFKLCQAVERQELTAAEARSALVAATGIFAWPLSQ